MGFSGSLCTFLFLYWTLIFEVPYLNCFQFIEVTQNPLVVIIGHNSTDVKLQWEFELDVNDQFVGFVIKRYIDDQHDQTKMEMANYYSSGPPRVKNGTLYALNASYVSPRGFASFLIKNILFQVPNKDGTKFDPLQSDVRYVYTIDVTIPNLDPSVRPNTIEIQVKVPPTITAFVCQGCQDGSAMENQTITLLCNATGKPIPNIRWMKNGEYYNGSSSVSSPMNKLVFQQIVINDKGNYTCIADNGVGNPDRKSLTLYVKYKPTNTLLSPTKLDVCENTNITLNCTADAYPSIKNYSLYNGNTYIGSSSNGQFTTTARSLGLNKFCCVASNEIGSGQCAFSDVYVLGDITTLCKINNKNTSVAAVKEGDKVVLQCDVSGNESYYVYQWTKVKDSLSVRNDTRQLSFSSINRTDEGYYQVTLRDKLNCSSQTRSFNITVNYKPENTVIKITPDKKNFCKEESINISCTSDATPAPVYSLYRNSVFNSSNGHGVFVVKLAENGNYTFTCVSNNTVGIGPNKSESVTVRGPLMKTCKIGNESITNKTVVEGSEVVLLLESSEMERLGFAWKNNTVNMLGEVRHSLTFKPITRYQGGQYQVAARDRFNCSADMECDFTLNVHYFDKNICKPSKLEWVSGNESRNVVYTIKGLGNPKPTLTCTNNATAVSSGSEQYNVTVDTTVLGNKTNYSCVFSNEVGNCSIAFIIWKRTGAFKVKFKVKIVNIIFTSDLEYNTSSAFLNLSSTIKTLIMDLYKQSGKEYLFNVYVINFVKGSVWVNFELELIANVPNPLQPLQDALVQNKGNLSGLMFSESSLSKGFRPPNTSSTTTPTAAPTPTTTESSTPISPTFWEKYRGYIIGAIIGVLSLIGLLLVIWWRYRKKRIEKNPVLVNNNNATGDIHAVEGAQARDNAAYSTSDYADRGPSHAEGGKDESAYAAVDMTKKTKKKKPEEKKKELTYAALEDFQPPGGRGGIVLEPLPKGQHTKMPEKYEDTIYAKIVGTKKPASGNQNAAGASNNIPLADMHVQGTETESEPSDQTADPAKQNDHNRPATNKKEKPPDNQGQPPTKEDSADSLPNLNGRNNTTMTTVSL